MKKIVLAIDSFKGCLSSGDVEDAVEAGLEGYDIVKVPVTDGGDGMLDAFTSVLNIKKQKVVVHDALMRRVEAEFAITDDGIAIIESAQACGIMRLKPEELNPRVATSYGVGELIARVLKLGARKIVIGLGGSATSDCGLGMLNALIKIYTWNRPGKNFDDIHIPECKIDILSDVNNPLYGEQGAAAVFGPQKGATPEMIEDLDRRAKTFATMSAKHMGYDRSQQPGAGAAGGLGYALMQFLGAKVFSGAEYFLNTVHFDDIINGASLVVTGEGSADRQTLMGKIPSVVLQHAKSQNIPVALLAGKIQDAEELKSAGFQQVININDGYSPEDNPLNPDFARQRLKAAKITLP